MKKIISAAISVLVMLAVLPAITAFAENGAGTVGAEPFFSDDEAFTIEASETTVEEGAEEASFDVYFRNIPKVGLEVVKFTVKVEGATFVSATKGEGVPGSVTAGDAGKESMGLLWIDIEEGIYEDTLVATFTVKLPEGLEAGDSLPVNVKISPQADNYLSFEKAPETGMEYNVAVTGVDGKISVVAKETTPVTQEQTNPVSEKDTEKTPEADSENGISRTVLIIMIAVGAAALCAAVVVITLVIKNNKAKKQ